MRALGHQADAARGRLAGTLRERGRVPGIAARLGGARPLRHRLPPSCARRTRRLSTRPVSALHARHLCAGLENRQRSQGSRQGDLAVCGRKGASFIRGDVGLALPSGERIAIQLRHGRTITARHARHRRRRMVASSDAAARRDDPARNRARLQHDAAAIAFDIKRQLIFSGHGFVITPLADRHPRRRRRRARRHAAAAEFHALEGDAREGAGASCRASNTGGGREWMGFRPSLPDSLPVIGRAKHRRMSSMLSGTAISA